MGEQINLPNFNQTSKYRAQLRKGNRFIYFVCGSPLFLGEKIKFKKGQLLYTAKKTHIYSCFRSLFY